MSVCTAKTSAGRPCKAQALSGATVCIKHGGSAPQVRDAARRRILALVDPALGVLAQATRPRKTENWEPTAQEIKAATDILDRAGLKEPEKLEVSGNIEVLTVAETLRRRRAARLKEQGDASGI